MVVRSTTERKNKQVSKVMEKISASETNLLIMRVAGKTRLEDERGDLMECSNHR